MENGIVISGIGILSPLGISIDEHLTFLKDGKSGLKTGSTDCFSQNIGTVPVFNPGNYIENKKSLKFFSQQNKLGCSAAEIAKRDAKLTVEDIKAESMENALIIGAGLTYGLRPIGEAIIPCVDENGDIDYDKLGSDGYRMLQPLWILSRLPNTTAGQISIQNLIKGLNYSIVNGANSGIVSVGESFLAVKHGRAVRVICGGTEDEISPDFLCRLREDSLVADSIEDSKPFSSESKGFICGEGACIFVVESKNKAEERGATVYGEILGYCNYYIPDLKELDNSADIAKHLAKCMRKTMEMASVESNEIDFIQASACGYQKMDLAEATAIRDVFGKKPYITSAQPYTGNTFASSGAVSVAFACMELQDSFIAPILYTNNLFLDDELNYVKNQMIENDSKVCLINSFSYLGEICSLIIRKR